VVPDEGVRHHHDLAGVGRVRADLLVARLARVDDEVATGGHGRTERHAREDRAILERQERRTEVADARIDDGGRPGSRWLGSGDHAASDTTNPPASRARWANARAVIRCLLRRPHRTDTPA